MHVSYHSCFVNLDFFFHKRIGMRNMYDIVYAYTMIHNTGWPIFYKVFQLSYIAELENIANLKRLYGAIYINILVVMSKLATKK